MKKPKAWSKERSQDRHDARETLTCQTLILEFLHFRQEMYDNVAPATQKTVQEFRNYLEKKKYNLYKKWQYFEEKETLQKQSRDNYLNKKKK